MEATDHTIRSFLPFSLHLKYLQLLCLVDGLPVIVEDGRGVQGLCVHLVAIVLQPDDDGVRVEYDLYILRLLDVAIWLLDGEGDEMIPIVLLKPRWDSVSLGAVTSLVQREACCGSHIWGFLWIVRISNDTYEWVLSWVEVPFAHTTGGAAPRAARCWCTDRHSASHAAILALLLATALANCSSLHVKITFLTASCDALGFLKRDW